MNELATSNERTASEQFRIFLLIGTIGSVT
jgi:hypothetical protein